MSRHLKVLVAGVDIGSASAKTVIMSDDGAILSYSILPSGITYAGLAEASFARALELAGLQSKDVQHTVSSGSGRSLVAFADQQITEITCHARGARHLFPEAHTVIDIGGQDSKIIWIGPQGRVSNFVMNDKCAAGTGRFLEVLAARLGVDVDRIGELSLKSQRHVDITSTCTVFAETDIITLSVSGWAKEDILAGLHRAISRRIAALAGGRQALRERVVISGGVAKNVGVVRSLESALGTFLLVPEEPQITGALGAALFALRLAGKER